MFLTVFHVIESCIRVFYVVILCSFALCRLYRLTLRDFYMELLTWAQSTKCIYSDLHLFYKLLQAQEEY